MDYSCKCPLFLQLIKHFIWDLTWKPETIPLRLFNIQGSRKKIMAVVDRQFDKVTWCAVQADDYLRMTWDTAGTDEASLLDVQDPLDQVA